MKTYEKICRDYESALARYTDERTDNNLHQLLESVRLLTLHQLMKKVKSNHSYSIVEALKFYKLEYQQLAKDHTASLEDLEKAKLQSELFPASCEYQTSEEIFEAAMRGDITLRKARELIELNNLIVSPEILSKLDLLEDKLQNNS